MSELLKSLPLGVILNSCVPSDDIEAHKMLCSSYLSDYILAVYRPDMVAEKEVILLY